MSLSLFNIIKTYINDISFKEALNSKNIYDKYDLNNNNILNYNPKQTKLFFSENKNKYFELSDVSNITTNYKDIINNSSFYEIPETIISQYEKKYQREKIAKIIRGIENSKIKDKKNININKNNNYYNYNNKKEKKESNYFKSNNNEYFSDEYNFYGNKKLLNFDYNYYWHKLISKNSIINELSTSPIKELISTEPEYIYIKQKICFPISKLFYIYNPDTEDNLLIKDIKSDLHQVKIFPYLPNDYIKSKKNLYSSINSYFPYSIFPQSKFVFQLLILPDVLEKLNGNLYIKFNDKKVLIIPITIIGIENEYKIKPIYYMNWQTNKKLNLPIKITNPSKKKLLIIKDIIYSFKKISLEWPNGIKVTNNYTSFVPSFLHIWPKETKIILYLNYFSETATNEYGFIHLKTDDNNLIVIPILINVKNYSLNTFPGFINFGLCDLSSYNRKNFIKMVPLLLMNYGNEDIELKRIYLDYDDKFLHFHRNNKNNNRKKIIVKKNSHNQFGYLIFDGEYAMDKDEKKYNGKIQKGSIYIETNSTIDPLVEIEYFYLTDYNKIIKVIYGDSQNITRKDNEYNFNMLIKYQPPLGFDNSLNHLTENMSIYKENYYNVKLAEMIKKKEYYLLKIDFEMKNLHNFYHRYIYVPFMIGDRFYNIIPIEIDNNNVNLVFCNTYSEDISLPLCIKPYGGFNKYNNFKNQYLLISTQFHFGSVTGEIDRKKYVYVINDNLFPINITEIKTTNINFTLDIENYYSINRNKPLSKIDYSLKGKLPNIIKKYSIKKKNNSINKKFNLILYPKTALLLSINIKSENKKNKALLDGDIFLSFNNNSGITISNKVNILIGDFSISPSNIRFEPAFPGLIQSKIIFCKNTYHLSLDISTVTSTDDRIIPILLTNKVAPGNKTSIIKIIFKPNMNSLTEDYVPELDMKKSLTYRELYLWKKNEEYWNDLGQNGKTEINANITVVTGLKTKIINVRSFLIKPNLAKKEEINYGLIQVGQLVEKYIEVYNPSDSTLEMKLFLAPDYFNDINNYSMFNLKEQKELYLDKNNVVTMLGCSFIVNQNNSYKNFFEYIIINENLNLESFYNNSISKEELLKKLYYYGNPKVKKYLYNSINVLCRYEKKYKNIFSINQNDENKYLMSEIFSSQFNNEIEIIKNMTTNIEYNSNTINQNNNFWGIFLKIFSKIFNYFIYKKEFFPNIQIQENKQSFYLKGNLTKSFYRIKPHQKFIIGPIIFKPNNTGKVSNILFLKNNLTILYPIKLKGEGGSGQITFINYYRNMKSKKTEIFNNTNFIIEINRDIYVNKMKYQNNLTRTITIYNSGNLPLIIKNVTIDNNECQTDDLKIMQCKEFLLDMGESIDIDIDILLKFGKDIKNRVVKFNTDYQSFELNVIIIISKDLYEQKLLYLKISKMLSLILIPGLISFLVYRKMINYNKNSINNKEVTKINNSHIENTQINNNENKLKEKDTNKINYNKKKAKNKKNRKVEKIEKENDIKKTDKSNTIDKYFKKTVIETNEENTKQNIDINNKNKTFGVIRLNKDTNKNNIEKEKNDTSNVAINKNLIESQKIVEKSEEKEKKVKKINKKKNYKNNEDKTDDEVVNKDDNTKSKNNSNKNEKIITANINTGKIIKKANNNINNIIKTSSNISNNINIKININLNSKEEDNDNDNDSSKVSSENIDTKLIEANIIHKNSPNDDNNNYNYDIKINNNNTKTSGNNIKVRTKNKHNKKNQKVKKVSNLNELLGITPKRKENKSKKDSNDTKKESKKEKNIDITDNFDEIFNQNNKKNEEKEEDEKSSNDVYNNNFINEILNNNNDENKKDNNSNDIDFEDFSTDFFNNIFKNENNSGDNDYEINEEDFGNCGLFDKTNSLYENPFCTNEKKGNLDELLKK